MTAAALCAAWAVVVARMVWPRTRGARRLTWLLLWWTLAATTAYPRLADTLVVFVGSQAITSMFWLTLLCGDLTRFRD